MLKIERTVLPSADQWDIVIEGMRNPKNSWDRSDSFACGKECNYPFCDDQHNCDGEHVLGNNDYDLMVRLAHGGSVHAKYRRMLPVWVTISAPLYWWKEFDQYKVGTVSNSCSTMHKIHAKEFTLDDFSCEHLNYVSGDRIESLDILYDVLAMMNCYRELYVTAKDEGRHDDAKKHWWQMIQLLPTSYNQKRTVMVNYEVLVNMYRDRKNHKLDEWHTLCDWIESLPHSDLITG